MKIKKIWIAAAVLTICIGVLWAANDVNNPKNTTNSPRFIPIIDGKDTLKGLQGIQVVIAKLNPEIEKLGLTTQQLRTDVELKLRQNGIKVLSEQEWNSIVGTPALYVNVNFNISKNYPVASFNINLQLYQTVYLTRDLTKICNAMTWELSYVGIASLSNIQSIRESVKDQVDEFINNYLAVNPK